MRSGQSALAKYLLHRDGRVLLKTSVHYGLPILLKVNHQLESRMPEIGLFGSGGGPSLTDVPTSSLDADLLPRRVDNAKSRSNILFEIFAAPLPTSTLARRRVQSSIGFQPVPRHHGAWPL